MGYVFSYNDGLSYARQAESGSGRHVFDLEHDLMIRMLSPKRGDRILDIGCGPGISLLPFLNQGLDLTGLDASGEVLPLAEERLGNQVALYEGTASDLPFDDNSFDHVLLVRSTEFLDDVDKSIEEALRVAKDRLFIGLVNKYSVTVFRHRVKGMFSPTIYNHARFESVLDMVNRIQSRFGRFPVYWKTLIRFPSIYIRKQFPRLSLPSSSRTQKEKQNRFFPMKGNATARIVAKIPVGGFAGIVVVPIPCFRTRPLILKYPAAARTAKVGDFSKALEIGHKTQCMKEETGKSREVFFRTY